MNERRSATRTPQERLEDLAAHPGQSQTHTMKRLLPTFALAALLLSSCADNNFQAYSGPAVSGPVAPSSFVSMVAGMPVYEGLPPRPYYVIGKMVTDNYPLHRSDIRQARRHGADAVVIANTRTTPNGSTALTTFAGSSAMTVAVPRQDTVTQMLLIKFQ
jgi:hypothetical protein